MVALPLPGSFIRRRPVLAFFVLAYAISWGLSLFAVRGLWAFALPPAVTTLGGLLYHFGPAFAAMIVTAGMAGDAGLRKLIRPLGCWRVAWYWYLLIAAYPIILHLAAAGIGVALGARAPIFFDSTNTGLPPGNPLVTGMVVFVATFVLTGLAEEIGWRGFALPMLQGRFSPLVASLILGALWAPWHYNPLNFPAIRSVLPWHIASVFAMTILLTFLYNSTRGNLWMCVLFHTSANWAAWLLPTSPIGGVDVRIAAAQTVLQLAVAVAVVLFFGVRRLAVRGAQPVTWR